MSRMPHAMWGVSGSRALASLGIACHATVAAVSAELEQVRGETDSDALASKAGDGAEVGGKVTPPARATVSTHGRPFAVAVGEATKSVKEL